MIDSEGIAERVMSIVSRSHRGKYLAVTPTTGALSKLIEIVFWSSLDNYEGNPVRARVFFAPKKALVNSAGIIKFSNPQAMSKIAIRRLAPAQSSNGGLLAVEDESGEISIEGLLGSFPTVGVSSPNWICVEARSHGAVRVSIGAYPVLEFTRGAINQLSGLTFDRHAAELLLMNAALFTVEPTGLQWHIASALVDIGFAIERLGHGGALWILPNGRSISGEMGGLGERISMPADCWEPYKEMWEMRTSIIRLLNPRCDKGHEFLQQAAQEWDLLRRNALTKSISSLAQVDGAIVVNGTPQVLAFGVICNRFRAPATSVLQLTGCAGRSEGEEIDPATFGGSRHRSAIDFCSSYAPAGALVASHDGGLTAFASRETGCVTGSRISLIDSQVSGEKA